MTCPTCDKGNRAVLYCRRTDCGLRGLAAARAKECLPEHEKFNEGLTRAKSWEGWMRELPDHAYAIAQSETRRDLLRLGEVAAEFANLVRTIKLLP